jgi:hypothetical protein
MYEERRRFEPRENPSMQQPPKLEGLKTIEKVIRVVQLSSPKEIRPCFHLKYTGITEWKPTPCPY